MGSGEKPLEGWYPSPGDLTGRLVQFWNGNEWSGKTRDATEAERRSLKWPSEQVPGETNPATRVCPRCGEPASDQRFCGDCGLNLAAESEIPTREEWEDSSEPAGPASTDQQAAVDPDTASVPVEASPTPPKADAATPPDPSGHPRDHWFLQDFSGWRLPAAIVVGVLVVYGLVAAISPGNEIPFCCGGSSNSSNEVVRADLQASLTSVVKDNIYAKSGADIVDVWVGCDHPSQSTSQGDGTWVINCRVDVVEYDPISGITSPPGSTWDRIKVTLGVDDGCWTSEAYRPIFEGIDQLSGCVK